MSATRAVSAKPVKAKLPATLASRAKHRQARSKKTAEDAAMDKRAGEMLAEIRVRGERLTEKLNQLLIRLN